MGTLDLTEDQAIALYEKYKQDLARVREERRQFYLQKGYLPEPKPAIGPKLVSRLKRVVEYLKTGGILKPQLDDIEAELTYMRIREAKPKTVVEISPCGGWSSTWILSALRDNGNGGQLYSYDLVSLAKRNVPESLAEGRWNFIQGDVTSGAPLPEKIDYLFIDSDHSAQFANWYIHALFAKLSSDTPVSVHDVYHTADADGFDGEGKVLVDWLNVKKIPFFTASDRANPKANSRINAVKAKLGFHTPIHHSKNNSMVFFNT